MLSAVRDLTRGVSSRLHWLLFINVSLYHSNCHSLLFVELLCGAVVVAFRQLDDVISTE